MRILIDKSKEYPYKYVAKTIGEKKMYIAGYDLTPELALEDLRVSMQSIIDKEAINSKY